MVSCGHTLNRAFSDASRARLGYPFDSFKGFFHVGNPPRSHDSSPEPVSIADVRSELDRILRSETFAGAPVLSRLLVHVVEHTIAGSNDSLKEYALGVDVFGRGESFDLRTDTIVRVQARRLRERLKDYYTTDGTGDPVRIDVPVGRYVATFQRTEDIRDRRVSLSAAEPRAAGTRLFHSEPRGGHLPAPLTSLVGREAELATITKLLRERAVRLLTLTGAGGSGKTRLALQVARDLAGEFDGGVHLVSLAPLTDDAFASAVARALGLRDSGDVPIADRLPAHVHRTIVAPTLLLLDNFEHLLASAPLLIALLESAADLTVLITSRVVLNIYGEHEFVVAPLELPEPSRPFAELERNPAVSLFAQRAAAANSGFTVSAANGATVAEICKRLDGLPLAIELAAGQTRALLPEAMLARLTRTLDFLTEGPRDLPARQRTLRATLDWSHALLSPVQQALLRRLAVFVGGWTLEGAEAVCNPKRDLGEDVSGEVLALANNSLLHRIEPIGTEARFTMLETVREYALGRLAASGDDAHTRRAHAAYCLVLAEEGLPRLTAIERESWLARCDAEHHNFRAAIDWTVDTRQLEWGLRLGLALYVYWERREHLVEARASLLSIAGLRENRPATKEWAMALMYAGALSGGESAMALHEQALEAFHALGDERGVAAQLMSIGALHRTTGNLATARVHLQQALDICRRLGDRLEVAASLCNLASTLSDDRDQSEARALLGEARDIFRTIGDDIGAGRAVNQMGDVARRQGYLDEALRLYEEAESAFERLGDRWGVARSAIDQGYAQSDAGNSTHARASFERALVIFADLRHRRGIARVLEGFAYLAMCERRFERALTLAVAGRSVRDATGALARPIDQAALDSLLESARRSVDGAVATDTWKAAQRLSLEDAIEFALSDDSLLTTRS